MISKWLISPASTPSSSGDFAAFLFYLGIKIYFYHAFWGPSPATKKWGSQNNFNRKEHVLKTIYYCVLYIVMYTPGCMVEGACTLSPLSCASTPLCFKLWNGLWLKVSEKSILDAGVGISVGARGLLTCAGFAGAPSPAPLTQRTITRTPAAINTANHIAYHPCWVKAEQHYASGQHHVTFLSQHA